MSSRRIGKYRIRPRGDYAEYYDAFDIETGQDVVITRAAAKAMCYDPPTDAFKRDIAMVKRFRHPNILRLRDAIRTDQGYVLFVTDRAGSWRQRKDLWDALVDAKCFSEDVARRYFQQIIGAVQYAHRHGMAHRGLTPAIVYLDDETNAIKIDEFGLAKLRSDDVVLAKNLEFTAPEVFRNQQIDLFASDVWSCGAILYVMLSGHHLFSVKHDDSTRNVVELVRTGEYKMSRRFSDGARDLISKILVPDPSQRYTLDDIIRHPWFEVNFDPATSTMEGPVVAVVESDVQHTIQPVDDVWE